MPGAVTVLTQAKVSGWATHPHLKDYPVVVHVVFNTRILCSSIADQPSPPAMDAQSNNWFSMSLANCRLTGSELRKLTFLIGESDEILDATAVTDESYKERNSTVVVEDLINANVRRPWVTGATYVEGIQAGLTDTDIIDLLYRDVLGRAADPEGLANYLFQRREGILSVSDIRKSLFDSDEYADRPKDAAHAPGAIFSQPIALLAATASLDLDETTNSHMDVTPEGSRETAEKREPDQLAAIDWPSYPERDVPIAGISENEILEVTLPVDSVLFGTGWHNVEYKNGIAFRWMETTGVIFNPKPELACLRIALHLNAVYGAPTPTPVVDCYFDDELIDVHVEESDEGFLIILSPQARASKFYTKCRIESLYSGCPVREDRGNDPRILSLSVLKAVIAYRSSSSTTSS